MISEGGKVFDTAPSYGESEAVAGRAVQQLGIKLNVRSYEERSMGKGGDAKACAFVEVTQNGSERECYGVGMDANIVTASIKALISGLNRLNAASGIA